ncbi:MAG: TlpA family protein disulfide reductase [Nitrospirota bacterium]|nr:TlpA family protein disulfide reductase [Nitrospirota bacterium]
MNLRYRSTGRTIFLSALILLLGCTQTGSQQPAIPGNPAPAFSLRDTESSPVALTDFSGKAIVLDFWATWCGPCKDAMTELEALHRAYQDKGVVVIGISVNKESDATARVKAFAGKHGMTYRLLIDDGSAYKAYGITRIPATVIIDRSHLIRTTYPGFRPGIGKEIAADIDGILAAR